MVCVSNPPHLLIYTYIYMRSCIKFKFKSPKV